MAQCVWCPNPAKRFYSAEFYKTPQHFGLCHTCFKPFMRQYTKSMVSIERLTYDEYKLGLLKEAL